MDKFTLTLTYDRDEIYAMVQKAKGMNATLSQTKDILDTFYPAWSRDPRTSITIELMFRGEDDEFHQLLTDMLAELGKS